MQEVTSRQWQPVTDSSESHEDISSTALARKNSLWKGIQRIPLLLEEIDKPVVAKIHGAAVGAGLDMALMCDVRIAGENASMSESYFNAGIVPGDGGAYSCPVSSAGTKL